MISIFVLSFTACPNDVMRDLVEVKVSDPVADTFIINSGAPTASRTVTLNSDVTKEDDALEMRFKNESGVWSDSGFFFVDVDTTIPSAPGIPQCTPVSDGWINNSEYSSGVSITVNFAGSGAVSGDVLNLYVNGVWAAERSLNASNIASGNYTFSGISVLLGGDGVKTVEANIVDGAGNSSSYSGTLFFTVDTVNQTTPTFSSSPPTPSTDTTPTSAGSGVSYSAPSLWPFGVSFTWNEATDLVTPQISLQFKLVRSFLSNISTPSDAETNENTVMDWIPNTSSYTENNLSPHQHIILM